MLVEVTLNSGKKIKVLDSEARMLEKLGKIKARKEKAEAKAELKEDIKELKAESKTKEEKSKILTKDSIKKQPK